MSTYLQDLQIGLHDLFARHEKAILLGEDVLDPYGGAFKVSAGLSTAFPGRVLTTPISEAAITGVASGLALRGFLPIAEIMFGDFLTLCADQLVNHAAKFPNMYKGVRCPVILRTPMGGGRGYGPTHSQSIEKMFFGIPGLKVVAPSHFHRPGVTLRHVAEHEAGPVLFIEHKLLYPEVLLSGSHALEVAGDGYCTAVVRNYLSGEADICLIAYGGASRLMPALLRRLAEEEIRIILLVPECIDPPPLDLLGRFAGEARRIMVIEEGHEGFGWGAQIAQALTARLWGKLDCPIQTLASDRVIIPTSFDQEADMLLSAKRIEAGILEVLSWAA
ncbi:AcoB Pyruvate/2-oxoglutarate dehydrogenase complex, dehydrogenase (E1) component, eukaryotic type, beta subunit [Rhabdaerophilaceae bacterium]